MSLGTTETGDATHASPRRPPLRSPSLSRGAATSGAGPAGSVFTSLVPAEAGQADALREYLTRLGTNIGTSTEIPFDQLTTVHFCRWVVFDDRHGVAWLVFESNYDGTIEEHLRELVSLGAAGVHAIYRRCAGYPLRGQTAIAPGDAPRVVDYVRGGAAPYAAFYAAFPGKSAARIRVEAAVRDEIESFLDARRARHTPGRDDPNALYDAIVAHLRGKGMLDRASAVQPEPPKSGVPGSIVAAAVAALIVLLAAAPVTLAVFGLLRWKEATDPEDAVVEEDVGALAGREDLQLQNQLTHLVDVKPGILRRLLLRGVLFAIDLLARYVYNQGDLGGITTIHFARWVILDKGERLLFFSNYDGSWENYLGDFIDQAAVGLTGVWSNTAGFPRTQCLVKDGATDEERFKSWTRAHQIPTQLWYSAYRELTVFNIKQNARICAGLARRPATSKAMIEWLADF